MKDANPTFKQKAEYFRTCVRYYQKKYGMIDWEIEITPKEDEVNRASCLIGDVFDGDFNCGRILVITYDPGYIKESTTTYEDINRTALHEILEAQLSNLRLWSTNNKYYIPEFVIDEEIHRIIHTYESINIDEISSI